jgi:hypothetical protein
MTVTYMEILGSDGASRPSLGLERQTRDALRKYCELRWPTTRRKAVEREWGLTPDEARGICEGTASATTIDKVWKHPNGRWAVLLPVMAAVIGEPVSDFISSERRRHVEIANRHRTLGRDLLALSSGRHLLAIEPSSDGSRKRAARRG